MSTVFAYEGRDSLGKSASGEIEAESRDEAMVKLRRDGVQVSKIDEQEDQSELFPRAIRKTDIIYATSQLAVMVETGITLSTALDSIASHEQHPTLKRVLLDLKRHVESGDDFSSALARHPQHFDRTYVSLIRASEQTGTTGEMLDTVALYLRSQLETRQKVMAALAYPAVMLAVAVAVTIFLLTYILPKFEPLFSRKGVKLPSITVAMMTMSDLMIDYWYLWLAVTLAAVVGYFWGRRTPLGIQMLDWLSIHTPIIGPMSRKVALSRSIRTLGTMVASGVSMLDAIRITSEVSSNYYFERAWLKVLDAVTEGNRICHALEGDPLFPPTLVQMISAGEDTGKLDSVLQRVSSYYDKEVETSLKATTSLIEPLMITGMGVVVGGIALGLLMPIFQLSRGG